MTHIDLRAIKGQLQHRMHYPTEHVFEDDDFLTLDEAFDALLTEFFQKKYETASAASTAKHKAIKKGWLTDKQANEFADFCIRGWKIVEI